MTTNERPVRMTEEGGRPRLGRGLAALIGEVDEEAGAPEAGRSPRRVAVEFLRPNPRNPRRHFDPAELERLASSIRERGIIQPVVARAHPATPGVYEIVAGERRWRAAQAAGLHEVPIVVVEADDRTALEYAILENVQRADLNPIEEANGYQRLLEEFRYTQEELARIIGKSRPHLANTVRLLDLPQGVKDRVAAGEISAGHARALLAVKNPEGLARRVAEEGLTVREVEEIAKGENEGRRPKRTRAGTGDPVKDPDTLAVEKALEEMLGLEVAIEHRGEGGAIRIRYRSLDQLDALCRRLHAAG